MMNRITLRMVVLTILVVFCSSAGLADGELDFWVCGRDEGLPISSNYVVGVAMLRGSVPLAVFRDKTISAFDGQRWVITPLYRWASDVAEGPDGKVWFKAHHWEPGLSYIDIDCMHNCASEEWLGDFYIYCGASVDVFSWRGSSYLAIGSDSYSTGPLSCAFATYCDPSSDRPDFLGEFVKKERGVVVACTRSGDFLALPAVWRFVILHLPDFDTWDMDSENCSCKSKPAGCNSYFWTGAMGRSPGLVQIDAREHELEAVPWGEQLFISTLEADWRGLWVIGENAEDDKAPELEPRVFAAYWSFQHNSPEMIQWVPAEAGQDSTRGLDCRSRDVTFSADGALWFATEKAVCRWSPDSDLIPMPYQARVEARATEDRTVQVDIEFDNLRIIRNDAMLHLKIECLGVDEEDPVWLSASYQVYHEFQPQETFRYSFEYFPFVLPSMDRIRYSVYTTYIDVNAPPSDEEIITSNVATAEVRLD